MADHPLMEPQNLSPVPSPPPTPGVGAAVDHIGDANEMIPPAPVDEEGA